MNLDREKWGRALNLNLDVPRKRKGKEGGGGLALGLGLSEEICVRVNDGIAS